ncbi:MAG: alpha/beta hydrolase [Alphaproteobacteria bacterium]|nr:alpha/beta hydrolase [Alphaproteobacteria bacterium]
MTPADRRIADWQARGQDLDVFGRRLFTVTEGPDDAPDLVVLHGYPTSSIDFAATLPALSARYRVHLHDHLGYGLSEKPADYSYSLIEQAEHACQSWVQRGVTEAHLLAHDYGTSVATELLARRERGGLPVTLRSVTLTNGSVLLDLAKPRLIQWILAGRFGPTVAQLAGYGTFRRNLRATLSDPGLMPEDEVAANWTLLTRDGGRDAIAPISRYLHERFKFMNRWVGALRRLDLPTHILWGDRDPVARVAVAEGLAERIPGATLTWLEGLGHYPMVEDPARWSAGVLDFLAPLDP